MTTQQRSEIRYPIHDQAHSQRSFMALYRDNNHKTIAVMMTQFAPYTDYYRRKFKQFVYQAIAD